MVSYTRGPRLKMSVDILNLFLMIFEEKFDPCGKDQHIWDWYLPFSLKLSASVVIDLDYNESQLVEAGTPEKASK